VKRIDDSLDGPGSGLQRDQRNQWRVLLWSILWALSFIVVTHGIEGEWLPSAGGLAGVIATALIGLANVLAYRRYLVETDELRRKIEMDALAFAFGLGVIGGLAYWQLVVSGAAPGTGFVYVFAAMVLTYSAGVLIGRRKYS
jgi:hypothetical protein